MLSRTYIVALLVVFGLSLPSWASARTWIVDAAGGGDFTRIGDAILAAPSGDTVGVRPGKYDEFDGMDDIVSVAEKSLDILGLGSGPEDVRACLSIALDYRVPSPDLLKNEDGVFSG